jgi:hypothetical protein
MEVDCLQALFRRGIGLSADQGTNAIDLMKSEVASHGQEARNILQLRLLETEMSDALSGLALCGYSPRSMHATWR